MKRKKQASINLGAPDILNMQLDAWCRAAEQLLETISSVRSELKKRGTGRYHGLGTSTATVYKVNAAKVKAHKRRAFVAVRLNRPPKRKG